MYARHTSATLVLAAVLVGGCQQPRADFFDRAVVGEVMMHAELAANLRAIAVPGGRISGTENAERAAAYVADKCRAYGLKNVHCEPFEMQSWIDRKLTVAVLGESPRVLDACLPLGRTMSTPPEGVTAELLDMGEAKAEDFERLAEELRGKFAFVRNGETRRMELMRLACRHGAAGLVVMTAAGEAPLIGNGHAQPRPEPGIVIPHDEDLLARLERKEPVRLKIDLEAENWTARPNNVVAELPGRGPLAREVVILCAHLDGWHLGEAALDNGSGSAAILETARALAVLARGTAGTPAWQPRRTVRFIWFMGEELGLCGSKAYVEQHAAELGTIVAVINVDMPGSPRRIAIVGHPELADFMTAVRNELAAYELEQSVSESRGDHSDYAPFMRQGVATMMVWGELGSGAKHYHRAGDKYETVDRRATVQSSAVFGVMVRRLADARTRPTVRNAPMPPAEE